MTVQVRTIYDDTADNPIFPAWESLASVSAAYSNLEVRTLLPQNDFNRQIANQTYNGWQSHRRRTILQIVPLGDELPS